MISFKNGVLKINYSDEQKAKVLYEIAFIINVVTVFAFYKVKVIGSVTSIMTFVCAVFIWTTRKNRKKIIPYNFIWYGTFIVYSILSWIWSSYISSAFLTSTIKMIVIALIILSISVYVDTPDDLDRLMSAFIAGMVINISLEFMSVPVGEWFRGSMGSHFSGCNTNEIAFWAVCAEVMSFYKAYINNKKGFYILTVAFLLFSILTSSRKATVVAIVGPVIMIALSTYKKRYILKVLLVIGVAIALGYMIMTDEKLYSIVGRRFESMRNYYSEDTVKSDGSLYYRNYFIEVARELFYKSPIVGVGMGNFAKILDIEYASRFAYVHNNYWQILSELGIVGFVIYYFFYLYILVKLVKNLIINKSRVSIMFITLMGLLIGLEWGIVTVYSKTAQIIVAIAFTSTYVSEMDGRKYQYIKDNTNVSEELE